MTAADYVWDRLPASKRLVGRKVVDRLVAEAVDNGIATGPRGEQLATERIVTAVRRDGSLGLVVLSWVLPYIASIVVKLVLEWLSGQGAGSAAGVPLPRVES